MTLALALPEYAPFPYAPDDVTDAALDEAITFEAVRQSARFQVLHDAFVVGATVHCDAQGLHACMRCTVPVESLWRSW